MDLYVPAANAGCLMSYACGIALDRMARECLECGEDTLLRELCGDCPDRVQAESVAEAARQGDAVALQLIETAGRYFGIGLSTIVQVLNPDTIVIGGGLVHIGPLIMDPVLRRSAKIFIPSWRIQPASSYPSYGMTPAWWGLALYLPKNAVGSR